MQFQLQSYMEEKLMLPSLDFKQLIRLLRKINLKGNKFRDQRTGRSGQKINTFKRSISSTLFIKVIKSLGLNLEYVPSKEIWQMSHSAQQMIKQGNRGRGGVEDLFGPHIIDLIACDSNVMEDIQGQPLKYFTQYPSPTCDKVNMFL